VRLKLTAQFRTKDDAVFKVEATRLVFGDLTSLASFISDHAVMQDEDEEAPMGFKGLTNGRSTVVVTPDSETDED